MPCEVEVKAATFLDANADMDIDDAFGAGEDDDFEGSVRFGFLGLSVGLNMLKLPELFPPFLFFLGDFETLTLDGLRPGEKSDEVAAPGLGGEGERGK
jgi:hypothetical protein